MAGPPNNIPLRAKGVSRERERKKRMEGWRKRKEGVGRERGGKDGVGRGEEEWEEGKGTMAWGEEQGRGVRGWPGGVGS